MSEIVKFEPGKITVECAGTKYEMLMQKTEIEFIAQLTLIDNQGNETVTDRHVVDRLAPQSFLDEFAKHIARMYQTMMGLESL